MSSGNCLKLYKFKNEVYFNLLFYTVYTGLRPSLSIIKNNTLPPPLAARIGFGCLHWSWSDLECVLLIIAGVDHTVQSFVVWGWRQGELRLVGDTFCWMNFIAGALAYIPLCDFPFQGNPVGWDYWYHCTVWLFSCMEFHSVRVFGGSWNQHKCPHVCFSQPWCPF